MSDAEYQFELAFEVRDYECDMEDIVNNAVYQHYLEHARHKYFASLGASFDQAVRDGFVPVVTRAEIDYRSPLRSGERFTVKLRTERQSRLRIVFVQDIFRDGNPEPVLNARITATILNANGRPVPVEKMSEVLGNAM